MCYHDKLIDKLNQIQAVYAELLHMLKGSEDYSVSDLPNQDLHKLVANLRRQNEELHVTLMRIKEQYYQQQLSESTEQRKRYLSLQDEATQLRNQLASELEAKKLRQDELQQTYKQLIEQQSKLNVVEEEKDLLSKQLTESNRRLEEVKSGFKVVYNAHKTLEREHEILKQTNSQLMNDLEAKSRSSDMSVQEIKRLQQVLEEQKKQTEANNRTQVSDYESSINFLSDALNKEQLQRKQHEYQLSELNNQITLATEHDNTKRQECEGLMVKYAQLEMQHDTIRQQNTDLHDQLQQLSDNHRATCNENTSLKHNIEELKKVENDNAREIPDLKREEYIETLQQMILELESKLGEQRSLQMVMKSKDEFDSKIMDKLRKQVEQAAAQVTHYQNKCEEIVEVVSQLQQTIEKKKHDQIAFKTPQNPSTKRTATHSVCLIIICPI